MKASPRISDDEIIRREERLRDWFTEGQDEIMREIDGLDIGWGGSQRWATANMPEIHAGRHLDFACGYGTFLAQLGWRFPDVTLYGLNIDFTGPHACIRKLLGRAKVSVTLVQSDARSMPFSDLTFDSVSCFLGLQDMRIGFADEGVRRAVTEAIRVLKPRGCLILVDDFTFETLLALLSTECTKVVFKGEFTLDVKWCRRVAEAAIKLYSDGWITQARVDEPPHREVVYAETYKRMKEKMEQQFGAKGFYTPHGPIRMVVAEKTRGGTAMFEERKV